MASSGIPSPVPGVTGAPANLILASLPQDEYESVRLLCESHALRMHEIVQQPGQEPKYVYFPTNGMISALNVLGRGVMVEFATIGREGTTGVPLFLGMANPNVVLVSQVPGETLRMRSSDFIDQLHRSRVLAALVLRYSGLLLVEASQSAACNCGHQVQARCARWLLTVQDQAGGTVFPMTQEFLSQMLGVSRPSVALAAEALQRAGLIAYHRGIIEILDRQGLEQAACECYQVLRNAFQQFADYCAAPTRVPLAVGGA